MIEAETDLKMPMLEHLVELRRRLLWSVAALSISFLICWHFAGQIFEFLARPLIDAFADKADAKLIYTSLTEKFFVDIKVGFYAALFITFPIIGNHLWKFIAPGLYKNERGVLLPYLIISPVLFFLGGMVVYFGIMPLAWKFFLSYQSVAPQGGNENFVEIVALPKVSEYLSLVIKLIFAFGLFFQLPVVLSLLSRAGIVTADWLAKRRRYAIVSLFLLAAILTPPDIVSQIGLAVPGILLYEISILCARRIERSRDQSQSS